MTPAEIKTLKEVAETLRKIRTRIGNLPVNPMDDPDLVFTAAVQALNELKETVKAHRAANVEAHRL